MFDQTLCWKTNVATAAAATIITIFVCVDILVRKVPPLIAKARLCMLGTHIARLFVDLFVEQYQLEYAVRVEGSFFVVLLGFLFGAITYFLECFAILWTNTDSLRNFDSSKDLNKLVGWFPYCRVFVSFVAVVLLVVFQFSPTNGVLAVNRLMLSFGWLIGFVLSFYVARFAYVLHQHIQDMEVRSQGPFAALKNISPTPKAPY